jgi:glucose-6-phosphate isomerase
MALVNSTPEWEALQQHWQRMRSVHMRDLFAQDPGLA